MAIHAFSVLLTARPDVSQPAAFSKRLTYP
jgi:hypothetical protein